MRVAISCTGSDTAAVLDPRFGRSQHFLVGSSAEDLAAHANPTATQAEHGAGIRTAEFVAALGCLAFAFFFSIFVNAPLLQEANINKTPNPSKAPWYFLGLQELLTMFHPMVAGVTIPGMGIFLLILAPYLDRNPSNKPEDRKFAISVFTVQLMFWAVLVVIGSFFRGPGFNFVAPWDAGLFFEL